MKGSPGVLRSQSIRLWRLFGGLSLAHVVAAAAIGFVAGHVMGDHRVMFPRDCVFLGVAAGQLTLAATWAAYGPAPLAIRGLTAAMAVLIGGYGAIAGFGFWSGDSIRELSPYLLAAGELFLFTTAVLISIRCFFDRRIVHAAETATARREPLQFSLQQLLGLSAVWALPLGAPGLFSGSPSAAGESILSCSIVFPPVMLVAAPLGQAALTRHRPGRKLLFAAFALGALSLFESIAFVALAWRGMPTVVSRLTLVLWGIGSVAAFNGAIAAMVLPTLLVVRRAGYRFSQWPLTPAARPEPAEPVGRFLHVGVR